MTKKAIKLLHILHQLFKYKVQSSARNIEFHHCAPSMYSVFSHRFYYYPSGRIHRGILVLSLQFTCAVNLCKNCFLPFLTLHFSRIFAADAARILINEPLFLSQFTTFFLLCIIMCILKFQQTIN